MKCLLEFVLKYSNLLIKLYSVSFRLAGAFLWVLLKEQNKILFNCNGSVLVCVLLRKSLTIIFTVSTKPSWIQGDFPCSTAILSCFHFWEWFDRDQLLTPKITLRDTVLNFRTSTLNNFGHFSVFWKIISG